MLNAKQHTREAQIVAQAGRLGAVTVATNMAGRGVDILLGGNPEGLAREEVLREGFPAEALVDEFNLPAPLDELPEDYRKVRAEALARYDELLEKFRAECKAEGDKVRELGGLYVLGTERHESRRIDNQLRGRSGRQGDPGESRFYLSLDDELMRLFATGAMSWVMGKALPDDVPIEAKMVTKAIERAQNTVEQRNAEIRKNVLKYDEVMNEQRKVIYTRRDQILEGADLRETAHGGAGRRRRRHGRDLLRGRLPARSGTSKACSPSCGGYWPTKLTADQLEQCRSNRRDRRRWRWPRPSSTTSGARPSSAPTLMREIERQVMLRIIDQRWREHLYEMDYLQEGINLRAMGQKDPLVEWQREGYTMFGQMMKGIAQDFVRYVMHVQVVQEQQAPGAGPEREDLLLRRRGCQWGGRHAGRGARRRPRGRGGRWRSAGRGRGRGAAGGAGHEAGREGRDGRRHLATHRARAGAARSTSSATGSRSHSCGTSPTT